MCDDCRGRHRKYATTKRAKRKLEKAAVGAQRIGNDETTLNLHRLLRDLLLSLATAPSRVAAMSSVATISTRCAFPAATATVVME